MSDFKQAPRSERVRFARPATAAAVALLMSGCGSMLDPSSWKAGDAQAAAPLRVQPFMKVDSAPFNADSSYELGKTALAEGRAVSALAWFERALSLRPKWVDAINGQAVALSRLGRLDEAVAMLRRAVELQPDSAYLHGNLSVLMMRSGQLARARSHVEVAIQLSPQDATHWPGVRDEIDQRLAAPPVAVAAPVLAPAAAAAAAADTPVATAPVAASPLSLVAQPVAIQAVAVTPGAADAPTVERQIVRLSTAAPVVAAAAADAPTPPMAQQISVPRLHWLQFGTQVLELVHRPVAEVPSVAALPVVPAVPAMTAMTAMQAVPAALPALSEGLALPFLPQAVARAEAADAFASPAVIHLRMANVEISNGAGRDGLAAMTAKMLVADKGLDRPRRVTNYRHYKVMQTEIHYRGADERAQAYALARTLGLSVALVQSGSLAPGVGVRVVLGQDAAQRAGRTKGYLPALPEPKQAAVGLAGLKT